MENQPMTMAVFQCNLSCILADQPSKDEIQTGLTIWCSKTATYSTAVAIPLL